MRARAAPVDPTSNHSPGVATVSSRMCRQSRGRRGNGAAERRDRPAREAQQRAPQTDALARPASRPLTSANTAAEHHTRLAACLPACLPSAPPPMPAHRCAAVQIPRESQHPAPAPLRLGIGRWIAALVAPFHNLRGVPGVFVLWVGPLLPASHRRNRALGRRPCVGGMRRCPDKWEFPRRAGPCLAEMRRHRIAFSLRIAHGNTAQPVAGGLAVDVDGRPARADVRWSDAEHAGAARLAGRCLGGLGGELYVRHDNYPLWLLGRAFPGAESCSSPRQAAFPRR